MWACRNQNPPCWFDIELIHKPIDFEALIASTNRCIASLP